MGEIAANGVLANGDVHPVILQPHGPCSSAWRGGNDGEPESRRSSNATFEQLQYRQI
jgi:hypothetical protein